MEKKNIFAKMKEGLTKTRKGFAGRGEELIQYYREIDDEFFEELEDILIMADAGVKTSGEIMDALRKRVKEEKIGDPKRIRGLLKEKVSELLRAGEASFEAKPPAILLIVGVNGVGKTTTIGKLAARYKQEGRSVLVAAADTFRAAASEQLEIWCRRAGVPLIRHGEGADPGAVVFDAVSSAKSRKTDLLIVDTAGRLHNKKNLMNELEKIHRILNREFPEANKEVLLVLDATTGQNAVSQAAIFKETVGITGIILTKLDGTAKGGVVLAVKSGLNIPIHFIGVGEQVEDLQPFDAEAFAEALFEA